MAPLRPCLHCPPPQTPAPGFCSERGDSLPNCIQTRPTTPAPRGVKRRVRCLVTLHSCARAQVYAHLNTSSTQLPVFRLASANLDALTAVFRCSGDYYEEILISCSPCLLWAEQKERGLNVSKGFRCK